MNRMLSSALISLTMTGTASAAADKDGPVDIIPSDVSSVMLSQPALALERLRSHGLSSSCARCMEAYLLTETLRFGERAPRACVDVEPDAECVMGIPQKELRPGHDTLQSYIDSDEWTAQRRPLAVALHPGVRAATLVSDGERVEFFHDESAMANETQEKPRDTLVHILIGARYSIEYVDALGERGDMTITDDASWILLGSRVTLDYPSGESDWSIFLDEVPQPLRHDYFVRPGSHVLRIVSRRQRAVTIQLTTGARVNQRLENDHRPSPGPEPLPVQRRAEGGFGAGELSGMIVGGAGIVGLASGAWLGLAARKRDRESGCAPDGACPDEETLKRSQKARDLGNAATWVSAAGAAATVTGTLLYYWGMQQSRAAATPPVAAWHGSIVVVDGGAAALMQGAF